MATAAATAAYSAIGASGTLQAFGRPDAGRAKSARRNRYCAPPVVTAFDTTRQHPGPSINGKPSIAAAARPSDSGRSVGGTPGSHVNSEQPQGAAKVPPASPATGGGSDDGEYSGVIANAGPYPLRYTLIYAERRSPGNLLQPGESKPIPKGVAVIKLFGGTGEVLELEGQTAFDMRKRQQCLVATFPNEGWLLQRSKGMGEQERWCDEDGVDARDRAASGCWATFPTLRQEGIKQMTWLANGAAGKVQASAADGVSPPPGTTAADAARGFMERLLVTLRSIPVDGYYFYTQEELQDPGLVAAFKALQQSPYIPKEKLEEANSLLAWLRQVSSDRAAAEQEERQQQLDTPGAALDDQVRQNWEAYESTHPPSTPQRSRSSSIARGSSNSNNSTHRHPASSEQHRASTCTSPAPPLPSSASPVPTATITTSAGSQLPPLFLDDLMTLKALYDFLAGLDPAWISKVVIDLAGWALGGKPPLPEQLVTPAGIHVTLKNGSLDLQPGRYLEVGPGGKLRLEAVQVWGSGVPDRGLVHVAGEGASAVLSNCSVTCNLDQYNPVTGHQQRCQAVMVTSGGQATLRNCTLSAASGHGLKVDGKGSFASADNCAAQHCGMSGFYVGDDTASMTLNCCTSDGNKRHGFHANGPGTVLHTICCGAFSNRGHGFYASTAAKLVAQEDCMAGSNGKSGFTCVGVQSHLEAGPGCESHINGKHGYSALAGGRLYAGPGCVANDNQGAGFYAAGDRLAWYTAAGQPIIAQSKMHVSKSYRADGNVGGEVQQGENGFIQFD